MHQDINQRYPRLLAAMQWVAILSPGEAACCIRDYKAGRDWSGEAVNHFGGTRAVLQRAWETRGVSRKIGQEREMKRAQS